MKKKFLKEQMDYLMFQRQLLYEFSKRLDKKSSSKGYRKRMKEELYYDGQYKKELKLK